MDDSSEDSWIACKWELLNAPEMENQIINFKTILNKIKRNFKMRSETIYFCEIVDI